jgi:CheY-like chemotaxis protein
VVVIDDNEDGANSLKELLELAGHDVRVALNGPAGVSLARDFQPDVVICDIGLPGMDGYEVARTIRAHTPRPPLLIALSGYAAPEDARRAQAAGFDRHVAKPPSLDRLEALLGEVPAGAQAPVQS